MGKFNALSSDVKILKIAHLEEICNKYGYIGTTITKLNGICLVTNLAIHDYRNFSETEAYLRDEFFVPDKSSPEVFSASITDGQSRIEIILRNVDQNLIINQGQKVQITGQIGEHGEY